MTADRIAELERIVYGSGTSDQEREDAARELLELREVPATAGGDDSAGAAAEAAETAGPDADGADPAAGPKTDESATADPRRRVRRVIIAATAALVVGVLAGWQLGARGAEQQAELAAAVGSVFPGPRTQAEYLASFPVAAESPAATVFDRPATTADAPANPWTDAIGEKPAEYRLLATRADGVPVYAARDGSDYCLLVVMNEGGAGSTCTEDGRFPPEGLRIGVGVDGEPGATIDVAWRPDGSLTVLVPPVEGAISAR
ncbi:hypothetical protein [Agromyces cerinus]|uniref:Uncharacterized protein n=1 Tax=Agromyces cerinus subsp. cerinus TaxID=232089 RepID=A0A1N6GFR1_9MICO|nr:hypothetical protein [Agromyces cerinus]SIO06311.1 hypothetical protein SAMN05443544_2536 [Agromyces cerinus subsp. cerinus]